MTVPPVPVAPVLVPAALLPSPVVATGAALHLPGAALRPALTGAFGPPGAWADVEAVGPGAAAAVLGRKGLLAKDPATRLALCAVHRALGHEPGARPALPRDPRTAVVACGVLGSLEAVARVTAAAGGRGGVSVLDAPNVSPNVVASTVALWFRFGGPNLHVCSGAAAGWHGLRLAGLLLRSGRADRVVLVGAEPDDEHAAAAHPGVAAGAAAVVLARDGAGVVLAPGGGGPAGPVVGPGGFAPVAHWGDHAGAEGVVGLALAVLLATDGVGPVELVGAPVPVAAVGAP